MFLDRDGTLIRDVNYLTSVDQIEILPGVVEGIKLLRNDYLLFVVTNQSAIARGYLDEAALGVIHDDLLARFAAADAELDGLYYCPHLAEAAVAEYAVVCGCRKPQPGLITQAADDWAIDLGASYLIGDMSSDAQAGAAAGVRSVLVGGVTATEAMHNTALTFLEAAQWIIAQPVDGSSGTIEEPAPTERHA